MRPILLVWHGIVLHSFPVMIYAALLVTVFLTVHLAQAGGLNPDRTAVAVILAYVPAFVSARLFYVAGHWDRFQREPARILRRSEGGLSLYGGFLGIFAGAVPLLWALGLPFGPFFDAFVLGILGGLAVAKGGCLLNGCCYGHPTDHWCGVDLPDDRGVWCRRFPSQLMEMAWAAVLLLLMLAWSAAWRGVSPPSGLIACAALALHTAGRLVLQKLRDEGPEEDAAVRKKCIVLIALALLAVLLISL
jgi:phosphatidylglycerol:prolipoprotein diacylglycerol transferase